MPRNPTTCGKGTAHHSGMGSITSTTTSPSAAPSPRPTTREPEDEGIVAPPLRSGLGRRRRSPQPGPNIVCYICEQHLVIVFVWLSGITPSSSFPTVSSSGFRSRERKRSMHLWYFPAHLPSTLSTPSTSITAPALSTCVHPRRRRLLVVGAQMSTDTSPATPCSGQTSYAHPHAVTPAPLTPPRTLELAEPWARLLHH
jgi:hypothetical protein